MSIDNITTDNIIFVADMHELVNPNDEARRIWANVQSRTPTEKELRDLYDNSQDPLVEIARRLDVNPNKGSTCIVSLGDMVANRIDFGGGTEKSVVGKLGKEAREKGVPQHEYIAENYHRFFSEVQDWAYRNSLWTEMRFQGLEEAARNTQMIHINGNADAISSYIIRDALNLDLKTPDETFEGSSGIKHFYKDKPGIIEFTGKEDHKKKWVSTGPSLHYDAGYPDSRFASARGDVVAYDLAVVVPYTLEWGQQLKGLDRLEDKLKCKKPRSSMLLIHESPEPARFGKKESVEGLRAYEKALEIMPEGTIIIHGHTHDKNLVRYGFRGITAYQVCPNKGVSYSEIRKIS